MDTVTEASLAFNARWGRIASPWWAVTPEQTMDVQETQPTPPRSAAMLRRKCSCLPEHGPSYACTTHTSRGSSVTATSPMEGDVNKALAEMWAGVEWRTASGWALQYFARWESPELRRGSGSQEAAVMSRD
jgi:hypothetical protein